MQLTNRETILDLTGEWKGERAENGRPLVPDDILNRLEKTTTEQVWGVLRRHGYTENFAGGWKTLHPERTLVGRAVTCRYVPGRPDAENAINRQGKKESRIGGQNSWAIDELIQGDVIVVDMFGKIRDGVFAGDNLSTAIKVNTGRGMVLDGGLRDTQGVLELPDFNAFVRESHPSAFASVTMVEINGIIRIGEATCIPGDVVHGTVTGVMFIPPHLAEEVVVSAEDTQLRDAWGQQRISEGAWTPGQVDREPSVWEDEMEADFQQWCDNRLRDGS